MVARATKKPGAVADAVCVLATLKKKGEPDDVLLVRQFRPPMGGETIELPAGLVDERESAEAATRRREVQQRDEARAWAAELERRRAKLAVDRQRVERMRAQQRAEWDEMQRQAQRAKARAQMAAKASSSQQAGRA